MIEVQIEQDGPWIPLVRALTGMDLGIERARQILVAGLWGVRVLHRDSDSISFEAKRYESDAQFLWRSSSMATYAFSRLDGRE